VPTVSCKCATCTSTDVRDKRLRCSILLQTDNTTVVIDSGPDFRQQMMKHNVDKIDAIIYTHHHYDHIAGFDEIRAYNFTSKNKMPIYLNQKTLTELSNTFRYAFGFAEQIGGGVPEVEVNLIDKENFKIGDIDFQIIPLMHGNLEVLGFRIGDFAYCTDTNFISNDSLNQLNNLDILILDALRYHHHPTHFTVEEAIEVVNQITPKKTYFTHIAHQIKHEDEKALPENMYFAYDDLQMEIVI